MPFISTNQYNGTIQKRPNRRIPQLKRSLT